MPGSIAEESITEILEKKNMKELFKESLKNFFKE